MLSSHVNDKAIALFPIKDVGPKVAHSQVYLKNFKFLIFKKFHRVYI